MKFLNKIYSSRKRNEQLFKMKDMAGVPLTKHQRRLKERYRRRDRRISKIRSLFNPTLKWFKSLKDKLFQSHISGQGKQRSEQVVENPTVMRCDQNNHLHLGPIEDFNRSKSVGGSLVDPCDIKITDEVELYEEPRQESEDQQKSALDDFLPPPPEPTKYRFNPALAANRRFKTHPDDPILDWGCIDK